MCRPAWRDRRPGQAGGVGNSGCDLVRQTEPPRREERKVWSPVFSEGNMFRARLRTRGRIRYGQSYWFAENATWPLVVLEADSDEIVLSYSIFRYRKEIARIKKQCVQLIRRKRTLLSVCIEIIHNSTEREPFVLFWTFDSAYALGLLSYLGYKVKTNPEIITLTP